MAGKMINATSVDKETQLELVALHNRLKKFQSAQQEMSESQKEFETRMSQMEGQMTVMRGDIADIKQLIIQMTESRGDIADIKGLLTSMMLRQGPEIGETTHAVADTKKSETQLELVALHNRLKKFQSAQQEMRQSQKELGTRMSQMEGQMTVMRGDIADIKQLITQMTESRGDIADIKGLLTSMMLSQGPKIGETTHTVAGTKKKDELQARKKQELVHNLQGDSRQGAERRNKRVKITNEDTVVKTGEVSAKEISKGDVKSCSHLFVVSNVCLRCKETVVKHVRWNVFLHDIDKQKLKDFSLTTSEILMYYQGRLKDKKLILILDLDYTLLNSARIDQLTSDEQYLLVKLDKEKDNMNRTLFKLDQHNTLIKLRPFVHTFLKKAHKMFEMYIYTTGDLWYAKECANLLDPKDVYFPSKVLSRSELGILVGSENRGILLDDNSAPWQGHQERLIQMKRYHFFASGAREFNTDTMSLSELMVDEIKSDGILPIYDNVLKVAHELFFNPWSFGIMFPGATLTSDVGKIMALMRRNILKGCYISFCPEVVPPNVWLDQMGVRYTHCYLKWSPDHRVTHVVTSSPTTEVIKWARENNKFVVNPQWIEKANYLWKRPKEEDFPVLDKHDQ